MHTNYSFHGINSDSNAEKPDWLFVDEVQFMDKDMIDTLSHLADDFGINVIAYGLMTDFQGQLFEGSKRLVESADSIREIKTNAFIARTKQIEMCV